MLLPVGGLLTRILEGKKKKEEVIGQLFSVELNLACLEEYFHDRFFSHIENSIFLQSITVSLFSGCL